MSTKLTHQNGETFKVDATLEEVYTLIETDQVIEGYFFSTNGWKVWHRFKIEDSHHWFIREEMKTEIPPGDIDKAIESVINNG